eukprot:4469254-Amphidinium_carterae.1
MPRRRTVGRMGKRVAKLLSPSCYLPPLPLIEFASQPIWVCMCVGSWHFLHTYRYHAAAIEDHQVGRSWPLRWCGSHPVFCSGLAGVHLPSRLGIPASWFHLSPLGVLATSSAGLPPFNTKLFVVAAQSR